ncbi:hypothetical protein DPMN_047780 [Dreissena polymorpha]|uniref:Uncharacterized protein n=1 Tax=Dreissena polymorpha TaxID=45954 RepID=A0A9D4D9D2_DREPO|nr:hypothetical protein DPMN_047780 [Dreissena polymorpha]
MALGYMAINRVGSPTAKLYDDPSVIEAQAIPVEHFLSNKEDVERQEYRMRVIVGRIVTRHLQWFKENFEATPHIVHDNTLQSTRKSLIINLGVFNEDPSSTQGAIGIYEKLQKYVPVVRN